MNSLSIRIKEYSSNSTKKTKILQKTDVDIMIL